jgi:hypothetical protein
MVLGLVHTKMPQLPIIQEMQVSILKKEQKEKYTIVSLQTMKEV